MQDPRVVEGYDGSAHELQDGHLRAALLAARDRRRAAGRDLPGRDGRGAHPGPVVHRLAAGREPDVPAVPAGRFGPGPDRHHRSARARGRAGEGRRAREGRAMTTYTVDERGRDGEPDRPYTLSGTLEVVHTRDGGARPEHVLVYRRDDGRRVVEFRTGRSARDGAGAGYAVVAPEDLRRVIVEGCAGPQARAVARP